MAETNFDRRKSKTSLAFAEPAEVFVSFFDCSPKGICIPIIKIYKL